VSSLREASAVILLRRAPDGFEVFLVRRRKGASFMASAFVFPGGGAETGEDARTAAARELFEEAGVLLARHRNGGYVSLAEPADHERLKLDRVRVHDGQETLRAVIEREGLRLALDALILFSHWVTPPIDSRQFDTRFFMARIPPDQTPAHDDTETTHSLWVRPADAIAQSMKGEITLPPPTWSTLRELEPFESVRGALAWARRRTVIRRMPKAIERDGHRMLLLPGDPLHPDPAGDDPPLETRFVLIDRRWRAERPPT